MLTINDERFTHRAEIIWEKGTNRSSFFRGELDKYGLVDVGSYFLPSEITAAFLWAQLEHLDQIQNSRKEIWNAYNNGIQNWAKENQVLIPQIPHYATNNAHMFYLVWPNIDFRDTLIYKLKAENIHAVFHYQSLHKSPFYTSQHVSESNGYTDCLVRLPMWVGLDFERVIKMVELN